ncbi:MAG: sigma-70 family RNA polymerase sigma factor [Planctomycetaceae bacterium]|nr:sigma-70 family RNA polymerase sigma factor [Planctomycetaceae bacterium]
MKAQDCDESVVIVNGWLHDEASFAEVFNHYRKRLRQMVVVRLDRRLCGRIDVDDVLQESFLEAFRGLTAYKDRCTTLPVFLWLRLIVGEKLLDLHRHHLGVQKRSAGREVSLQHGPVPAASSVAIADHLMGSFTSPSHAAVRAETRQEIQDALNQMDALDREILVLRNFELLSNAEAAQELGISQQASSNRYIRALRRMKTVLERTREP